MGGCGYGGEIIACCGWSWVVGVKLWLVMVGGSELKLRHGLLWVAAAKLWPVVCVPGWSMMIVVTRTI